MRNPRNQTSTKENANDNYLRESPKRGITKKGPISTISKIPIPSGKNSKQKTDPKMITGVDIEKTEKEIEARIRLELKAEYSQKFHQLQSQYDQDIVNSSVNLSSSFFENYSSINLSQSLSTNENNEIQLKIQSLENEINKQKLKHQNLIEEKQKSMQAFQKTQDNLDTLLKLQAQLQDEHKFLSNQIGAVYARNSDLLLELDSVREQKQIDDSIFNEPDSFEGDNDHIDYGMSPPSEPMYNNVHTADICKTSTSTLSTSEPENYTPKKTTSKFDISLLSTNHTTTSEISQGSQLEEDSAESHHYTSQPLQLNTIEIEDASSSCKVTASGNNNNITSSDSNSDELPKELFRAPYRIKIPVRPPKK